MRSLLRLDTVLTLCCGMAAWSCSGSSAHGGDLGDPSSNGASAGDASAGAGAGAAASGGSNGGGASGNSTAGAGMTGSAGAGTAAGAGAGAGGADAGASGAGASGAGAGGAGASGAGGAGASGAGASGAGAGGAGASGAGAGGAGAGGAGAGGAGASGAGAGGSGGMPTTVETVDITDVWSGHPVFFALFTRNTKQFAAFYDKDRNMTVASRTLGSTSWALQKLPSVLGWDSHNYVAMTLDSTNQIHVSGNQHAVPLVYFRTSAAEDITTFSKLSMVGTNETSVTYPVFFNGPGGELIFEYRDGSSGNGNTIFNGYDTGTKKWTRLLNSALLDGQGQRNAYPEGPVLDANGYFHLVWVWRDTPDASTNHDLSYARSKDLVNWEAGNGRKLTLPITLANGDIVDPVPPMGGMINNNTRVGFDAQGRPVITYHKFDTNGNTQLYAARLENAKWVIHQMTDWNARWNFGGGGTLVFQIEVDTGVHVLNNGQLAQDFYNANLGGRGTLILDPNTLHATQTLQPALTPYPPALDTPQSTTAGMHVRWAEDSGAGPDPNVTYMLRWETLDANGDQPRATIPAPTKLRLYAFQAI